MSIRKKRMISMVLVVVLCSIAVWFAVMHTERRDAREFAEKCRSYVGIWTSDDGQYEMTVRRVTGAHMILSLNNRKTKTVMETRLANNVGEGRYEFTYKFYHNVYSGVSLIEDGDSEKGNIELLDSSIRLDIPIAQGQSGALEFQGTLRKKKALAEKKQHLLENMGTTNNVPTGMEEFCSFDRGSDGKVERIRMLWETTGDNYIYSDINGINKLCFAEDCRALFGREESEEELENGRRRLIFTDDTYRYAFVVNKEGLIVTGDCLYLERQGRSRVGDFLMQGDTVVRYLGDYEKAREIVLPEGTKRIASHAFTEDIFNYSHLTALRLTIPKDVVIEKDAFAGCGRMEIGFEEGRTEIPEGAFANIAGKKMFRTKNDGWVNITLPKSLKTIGKNSFCQEKYEAWAAAYDGYVTVNVNDGLEVIGENALKGILVTGLPDTVKRIERGLSLTITATEKLTLRLPKGLEELASGALSLSITFMDEIIIPASLRVMEEDAFADFDLSVREIIVEKDNPYFKTDKFGWLTSKDGKILYMAPNIEYQTLLFEEESDRGKKSAIRERIQWERSKGDRYSISSITITIPEGVEEIRNDVVKHLDELCYDEVRHYRIILPKSLKRISRRTVSTAKELEFRGNVPEFTGTLDDDLTSFQMMDSALYVKKNQGKAFRKKLLQGQNHISADIVKDIKKKVREVK